MIRPLRAIGHGSLVVAGWAAVWSPIDFGMPMFVGAVALTLAYVFDKDMR